MLPQIIYEHLISYIDNLNSIIYNISMLEALITSKSRRLLLKELFLSKESERNYSLALSKRLGMSYMPIQKELISLEKDGLVISRRVGKTVIYEVNKDYPLYRELRALISKIAEIERRGLKLPPPVKDAIDLLAGALTDDCDIFIFGSRAAGKEMSTSDWDIGFFQKGQIELYELLLLKQRVRDCAWPYRIDVVDFSRVTDEFKELAMKSVFYIKKGSYKWMKN